VLLLIELLFESGICGKLLLHRRRFPEDADAVPRMPADRRDIRGIHEHETPMLKLMHP
jgi:hypothetical protein